MTTPSPLSGILFIHNAIIAETGELEEVVEHLNWEDNAQVATLQERVGTLREVLKEHEDSEEEFFFPAIEEKFRFLSGTYVFDHRDQGHVHEELYTLLGGLQRERSERERSALARRLRRRAVVLNVGMSAHIAKENELLFPLFDEHFTVEEVETVLQGFHSSMPPEKMMGLVPWIFLRQTPEDREGMLRTLKEMVPPQAFPMVAQAARGGVTPEEWQDVVGRMPELAS